MSYEITYTKKNDYQYLFYEKLLIICVGGVRRIGIFKIV